MKRSWKCAAATVLGVVLAAAIGCTNQSGKKPEPGKQPENKSNESGEKMKEKADKTGGKLSVTKEPFGKTPKDAAVDLYTLTNANGLRVKIMTYGATITSVDVPDRDGKIENVTLSLDSLADYIKGCPYFGATVGRYANRIAKGEFKLDGKTYSLAKNNDANHLHGGSVGFDKQVWKAKPVETADSAGVVFTLESPDGDEGYPGKLSAQVTYTLTNSNELKMDYEAVTDKPTVVNLTNHTYWNLGGAGDVLGHEVTLNADRYLPVDAGLIPTGELKAVKDTPMDFFTKPMTIGSRIAKVEGGYDHCYVLAKKGDDEKMTLVAKVVEPKSGRVMEIVTTQPAVQFYTGNFLDGTLKSGDKAYQKHAAFCLETQHYPDSPNRPEFPSVVLKPGEKYRQSTVHKFSVK